MFLATTARKHQTKPYYHEDYLLLQFVLAQLLHAHRSIKALKSCTTDDLIPTPLALLAGSGTPYMRLFLSHDDGVLAKLKNDCALLTLHFKENPASPCHQMHELAHQGWLLALQAQEKAHRESIDLPTVSKLADQLEKILKEIALLAQGMSETLNRNEEVLFFLIRHNEEFKELMGAPYVAPLLNQMFQKGIMEAEEYLLKQYAKRGFTHLAPTISLKCRAL